MHFSCPFPPFHFHKLRRPSLAFLFALLSATLNKAMVGTSGAIEQASAAVNNVASSRLAEVQTGGTDGGRPAGFLETEVEQSEGISAADNNPGPFPAYSAGEAFSAAASVAEHSPAAGSVGRGESVPPGFFEVQHTAFSCYAHQAQRKEEKAVPSMICAQRRCI